MLTATEFYPVTTTLLIVLWIEAIIYLGTGLFEIFDDFFRKTPGWVFRNKRLNLYAWYADTKGHKSHAVLAMMLGLVALNGVLEQKVTRFEIELIFLSLAMLNGMIFGLIPPDKRAVPMCLIAPEFYLQISMFVLFSDLIRPEVIGLCVLFNAWGIFVLVRRITMAEKGVYNFKRFNDDKVVIKQEANHDPFRNTIDRKLDEVPGTSRV
ncbi:hypothetical protein HBA55_22620 [Pseudomaricurvus alkylphenolicus]|uniref:hypothetical protein n=1 Tax=Pseudomaricurvus alkylphenolicus TaxID=1306991 RepID=UPI00141D8F0B|nr:hypothetical protein [Pseudomaricurvus alkylphenolicus]NIB42418.1 hypothetical protein [Pseudomaricurvus alkylphenolicus]